MKMSKDWQYISTTELKKSPMDFRTINEQAIKECKEVLTLRKEVYRHPERFVIRLLGGVLMVVARIESAPPEQDVPRVQPNDYVPSPFKL